MSYLNVFQCARESSMIRVQDILNTPSVVSLTDLWREDIVLKQETDKGGLPVKMINNVKV